VWFDGWCYRNVDVTDEGDYVCRAANEGGHSEQLAKLLIQSLSLIFSSLIFLARVCLSRTRLRRLVTLALGAGYKYSYLLTYLLTYIVK